MRARVRKRRRRQSAVRRFVRPCAQDCGSVLAIPRRAAGPGYAARMAAKKKTRTSKSSASLSFEQRLEALEAVVEDLEGDELSLEDALARYKIGMEHLKACRLLLDRAEKEARRTHRRRLGASARFRRGRQTHAGAGRGNCVARMTGDPRATIPGIGSAPSSCSLALGRALCGDVSRASRKHSLAPDGRLSPRFGHRRGVFALCAD